MKMAILDDYQNASSRFACIEKLREQGELLTLRETIKPEELARRLKDINIILPIRERTKFGAELLEKLSELRFISMTGASANNIDLEAATRMGILVSVTSYHSEGAVELTLGLILALLRNIPAEDRAMRNGKWQTTIGTLLNGKTLGILGLGRVGREVARIAQAFGMKIIAWGPSLTAERAVKSKVEMTTLAEVLNRSDIVSVHVRLSDQSRGLIGWNELKMMKKSAFLINTARGDIIDESALIKALETGIISGAALDCYHEEPIDQDSPLLKMNNVVLSPHAGFVTYETFQHYFSEAVENILNYLSGSPANIINMPTGH